jgi:chemotaxis protein methyltransferase CheR
VSAAASIGAFERFAGLVKRATGIVLEGDKRPLVEARLGGLVRAGGFDTLDAYLEHVVGRAAPAERAQVLDLLTTNTTSFFREAHHFELLRREVLPARRASSDPLRAWSAACSTGEEAFSLAMSLLEARAEGQIQDFRVLATDISLRVLAEAKLGVYPRSRLRGLSRRVLEAHFEPVRTASGPGARVAGEARDKVSFHPLNLVDATWRFRHRFELIFCRNVLIYFDAPTRRDVVTRLVDQLAVGGHLVLGHADNALTQDLPLVPVGPTFYRRVASGSASKLPAREKRP